MLQIKSILLSKHKSFFVLLAFVLIVIGCNSSTEVDRSFLTKIPCAAPCWYGLTPGVSVLDDVYNVLEQLPFIEKNSIIEKEAYWLNDENALFITYGCIYDTSQKSGCGNLTIYNGKLLSINMRIAYELRFKDVVTQIGNPSYASYFMEIDGCRISLIWNTKNISATSKQRSECPSQNTKVNADFTVSTLTYSEHSGDILENCKICFPWEGFLEE
jgi:hypothetical protein